mmetsp:Transcript_38038/g.88976  ORF Transcript_38038/g.88976 Transcript_38038/m.88976 type:complete len:600 (-) Transcript_38038:86-1885(-)
MIDYDPSGHSFGTLLSLTGSVIPSGLMFAIPCGILGGILCALKNYTDFQYDSLAPENSHNLASYMAFNSILGFLIVFRTQNAYSRFWEGTTLLQQVRGEWYSAVSSLFAFFTTASDKKEEVDRHKHLIIRLMSLMYCAGLQSVAVMNDIDFEVIDTEGMEKEQLIYMSYSPEPPLVILQWLQQVIVSSIRTGVTDIPAPIVSRVFQELSNGLVHLQNVAKISDTLFPFAYAQMISVMLLIQFCLAPVFSTAMTDSITMAALGSFMTVFLTACMNLIASEIEMPFGDDPNDLEVKEMQKALNANLVTLMDPRTSSQPQFVLSDEGRLCKVSNWVQCVSHADDFAVLGVRKGALLKAKTEDGLQVDVPANLAGIPKQKIDWRSGTVTDLHAAGGHVHDRHRKYRQRRLRRLRKVVQPVLPTLMAVRRPSERNSLVARRVSGCAERRPSASAQLAIQTSPIGAFPRRPSVESRRSSGEYYYTGDPDGGDGPPSLSRNISNMSNKVLNFFTGKGSRAVQADPVVPAADPPVTPRSQNDQLQAQPHEPPSPPPPVNVRCPTDRSEHRTFTGDTSEPLREAHELTFSTPMPGSDSAKPALPQLIS